ncbi:hypothetical protein TEA_028745 [Camellia sinensis var. sinensis]|uniref:BHLH domain-containing protein n=1 Tax=Camellia sinensis var. sinensis TaxID=542762 RepID=A0A4S4D234_CAMSN|nr:hypothetical protein TEA_028745 [Camellia sinensis var. sinensis]
MTVVVVEYGYRLDYEVAELTWENGQLAMHGLGTPRVPNKPPPTSSATTTKYTWEKPRAGGTLESIVNQATCCPIFKPSIGSGTMNEDLVPWFDHHHRAAAASATATMTMDALVPCSTRAKDTSTHVLKRTSNSTCMVGSATPVGSCSGANTFENNGGDCGGGVMKRARVAARVPVAAVEWSSRDNSVSGGSVSRQLTTIDTGERELDVCGFTSTSMGSPENTSSAKQCTKATTTTADDHDSVCHSRPQKRRDKINQRMRTLQKMVPNSSKTDKASMLDEVIEYLKQLQAQVQMMSRMNMSSMMMPMTLQQQLQLSMMAPMGMGMGIGMGMGMGVMDMNTISRSNIAGIPPLLHPTAFMPLPSWDGTGDRLSAPATVIPDPMSAFLACQPQPMTMDAYTRMAALFQQLHQPPSTSKT